MRGLAVHPDNSSTDFLQDAWPLRSRDFCWGSVTPAVFSLWSSERYKSCPVDLRCLRLLSSRVATSRPTRRTLLQLRQEPSFSSIFSYVLPWSVFGTPGLCCWGWPGTASVNLSWDVFLPSCSLCSHYFYSLLPWFLLWHQSTVPKIALGATRREVKQIGRCHTQIWRAGIPRDS